ncbi:MAG: hypothetical protein Q8K75_05065 [Chlamydiales bacterium]|nr:hypothetical protein [Chlamydiales bacterium]
MRLMLFTLLATLTLSSCDAGCCYGRRVRTAMDCTPGHCRLKLDSRYGAADIRIQTRSVACSLMDRWFYQTAYDPKQCGLPRIVITQVDNRTDQYIATDMIRDVLEGVAVEDGRFIVTVGDHCDEQELDWTMNKIINDPKYSNSTRLAPGQVTAPQFLGKVRLTKAVTADRRYDYEEYRMTITLYDIETQQVVDSAWDTLYKKVRRW